MQPGNLKTPSKFYSAAGFTHMSRSPPADTQELPATPILVQSETEVTSQPGLQDGASGQDGNNTAVGGVTPVPT